MALFTRRAFVASAALSTMIQNLWGQAARNAASSTDDDVILKAMRDELERSKQLRVIGAGGNSSGDDIPYFISYTLDDADNFGVNAAMGAITGVSNNRYRIPLVEVRVGSYDFDNTGHVRSGLYSGSRYDTDPLPLDDIYIQLREGLWLATDHAFKAAIESIARKRAALSNAAANPDKLPDFSKADPVESLPKVSRTAIDTAAWTTRIAKLSGLARSYPSVLASGVEFHCNQGTTYVVNSEGTAIRYRDDVIWVYARAEGQAEDGMIVREGVTVPVLALNRMPSEADLQKLVGQVNADVQALSKAPSVTDAFIGPVLFEPLATAQLLAQLLGDNLHPMRSPVSDPGHPVNLPASEFEGRIGSRILPEWMDVMDDPTQTTWQGNPLLGTYPFDFEGVKPKPVSLIEKGVLKAFLSTRQPAKNAMVSNGHARLMAGFGASAAAISNLFVKTTQLAPMADLKAKLIQVCKDREKPYGLLIRKLDFPYTGGNTEAQALQASSRQSGGSVRPISPPVLAYRVYPDGREELVRGLRFKGLSTRSLRDAVGASSETVAFDYINNGAPMARVGVGGYIAPTTVIAPGLFFDELELERGQEQLQKPPIVPPPLSSANPSSNTAAGNAALQP